MFNFLFLFGAAAALSCVDNPCNNGCQCETSCKDENDYYCRPQGKRKRKENYLEINL